jgi:hypothetical protein
MRLNHTVGAEVTRRTIITALFVVHARCTRFSVLLALAFSLQPSAFAQVTNSIGLAWNSSGSNLTYRLFLGTNSGNYQRQFNCAATNIWLDVRELAPGTNYIALATVQYAAPDMALVSPLSGEVRIVRIPAPEPLRITIADALQSSSNLVAWSVVSNQFTLAVAADQPAQFYRPNPNARVSLARIPDTILITP